MTTISQGIPQHIHPPLHFIQNKKRARQEKKGYQFMPRISNFALFPLNWNK